MSITSTRNKAAGDNAIKKVSSNDTPFDMIKTAVQRAGAGISAFALSSSRSVATSASTITFAGITWGASAGTIAGPSLAGGLVGLVSVALTAGGIVGTGRPYNGSY